MHKPESSQLHHLGRDHESTPRLDLCAEQLDDQFFSALRAAMSLQTLPKGAFRQMKTFIHEHRPLRSLAQLSVLNGVTRTALLEMQRLITPLTPVVHAFGFRHEGSSQTVIERIRSYLDARDEQRPVALFIEHAAPPKIGFNSFALDQVFALQDRDGSIIPWHDVLLSDTPEHQSRAKQILREKFTTDAREYPPTEQMLDGTIPSITPDPFWKQFSPFIQELRTQCEVELFFEEPSFDAYWSLLLGATGIQMMPFYMGTQSQASAYQFAERYIGLMHQSSRIREQQMARGITQYHLGKPDRDIVAMTGSDHTLGLISNLDSFAIPCRAQRDDSSPWGISKLIYQGTTAAAGKTKSPEWRRMVLEVLLYSSLQGRTVSLAGIPVSTEDYVSGIDVATLEQWHQEFTPKTLFSSTDYAMAEATASHLGIQLTPIP